MNIVLIVADQFRFDCIRSAGNPFIRTPNLDALAARGTLFTKAYSPAPSCVPARASLFTGLSPDSTGRLGYTDQVPWKYDHMLPEVLGRAGYQTHCVGKTHFFPQGAHLGFQSIDSYEAGQNFDGAFFNDYYDWLAARGDAGVRESSHGLGENSWIARPSHLPERLHNNTWVADQSIRFLERRDRTRPFFLNVSFHRPHPPLDPPQVSWDSYESAEFPPSPTGEWSQRYRGPITEPDAWHGELAESDLARMKRGYYAQISHIDNQIGRIMLEMSRMNTGPTAIIFTSDHGEMLGDHYLYRKSYAYEGSARVPMIVSVPGTDQRASCPVPVTLTDLYSTALEIANVRSPRPGDGASLVGQLYSDADVLGRPYIHGEHSPCYVPENAMQFLTDGTTKFIWNPVTGERQLFDLQTDPYETTDLSVDPEHAQRLERWTQTLVEHLQSRVQDGLVHDGVLRAGVSLPPVRAG